MDYSNSLNGSGRRNRVPSMPSTASRRAPNPNVDARLARTLAFTQRIKGTVGFEAFNLLNRQQVTAANAIAYYPVAPLAPGLIKGPQFGTMTRSPVWGGNCLASLSGWNQRAALSVVFPSGVLRALLNERKVSELPG